jgi:hypothetical protein
MGLPWPLLGIFSFKAKPLSTRLSRCNLKVLWEKPTMLESSEKLLFSQSPRNLRIHSSKGSTTNLKIKNRLKTIFNRFMNTYARAFFIHVSKFMENKFS